MLPRGSCDAWPVTAVLRRGGAFLGPVCVVVAALLLGPGTTGQSLARVSSASRTAMSTTFAGYRVDSPTLSSASLIVTVPTLRCGPSDRAISTGLTLVGGPLGQTIGDGVSAILYSSCYRGVADYEVQLSAESRQSRPIFSVVAGQRLSMSAVAEAGTAHVVVRDLTSGATWAETGQLPSPYRPTTVQIGDTAVFPNTTSTVPIPAPAFSDAEMNDVVVGGAPWGRATRSRSS